MLQRTCVYPPGPDGHIRTHTHTRTHLLLLRLLLLLLLPGRPRRRRRWGRGVRGAEEEPQVHVGIARDGPWGVKPDAEEGGVLSCVFFGRGCVWGGRSW